MKLWAVLLLLFFAGCASKPPATRRFETLTGSIRFEPERYKGAEIWTREDPRGRYEKNPSAWKDRVEVLDEDQFEVRELMRRLYKKRDLPKPKTEQEIWDRFRIAWAWSVDGIRPHPAPLRRERMKSFKGRTFEEYVVFWQQKRYFPEGSPAVNSNRFAQMLIQSGVPTDRIGLAYCMVPDLGARNRVSAHPYLILFLNDNWHYFDPQVRKRHPELPERVEDMQSVGFVDFKGVEYAFPQATTFYQKHPLKGRLPLVVK